MKLIYNGQDIQVDGGLSLQQILVSHGATPPFAVALNGQFVPAGLLPETKPESGDSIEVLSPIQGG
ncbi:sulfur carrier protein ThiS [Pseudoalteromonas sp. SMS1]|uniref:sulfur carrier protein ThiS n=1 Tax=Pseudoalteromonas sp. SMS1 TaxID=2908894 RepID=UPI001F2C67C9|nr:sulfur carrier protein ThiS [Pseudoalteromonas sp. SMS1]MCF2858929.1 sulfur carrier protein ThiS [Pseudoalteromonas sp. SMS1]